MESSVAIATDKDGRSLWSGHFGVSPIYTIFDKDGRLVKQIKNPYSNDKHHDNPSLIVELLKGVELFIAKNMGKKSREKLTNEFGVKSLIVNSNDIFEAMDYYLALKKNIDVFERNRERYENWFESYKAVYESELNMLKSVLPKFDRALEIGVGSGRFAYPLGIKEGVEPSEKMAEIARARGIKVYPGFAENLPLGDDLFDLVLIAVTICFVNDPQKTLKEAYRVLKKNGKIAVAIVDKNTPIGLEYLKKKERGEFYRNVNFFSTKELHGLLKNSSFEVKETYQTLFANSIDDIKEPQGFSEGYGEGGFVVVIGEKNDRGY